MKKTRRQKAKELMDLLIEGPVFETIVDHPGSMFSAPNTYKRWAKTWIVPLVEDLVPELKPKGDIR